MKSITRTFLFFFALMAAGIGLANAQVKIGTVDMNRVFSDYQKTKDAQAKYSEAEKAANEDLNGRVETLKKAMQEINQANSDLQKQNLSKEDLEAKRKELQPKIDAARALDREIADFRSTKQKALQDQFLRMRKDIVDDIMKAHGFHDVVHDVLAHAE